MDADEEKDLYNEILTYRAQLKELQRKYENQGTVLANTEDEVRSLRQAMRDGAASDATSASGHSEVRAEMEREEAERAADQLVRKVLENCPANIIMSRVGDGEVIYRSPAATELLGNAERTHAHFASRAERADFITAVLPDGRFFADPVAPGEQVMLAWNRPCLVEIWWPQPGHFI